MHLKIIFVLNYGQVELVRIAQRRHNIINNQQSCSFVKQCLPLTTVNVHNAGHLLENKKVKMMPPHKAFCTQGDTVNMKQTSHQMYRKKNVHLHAKFKKAICFFHFAEYTTQLLLCSVKVVYSAMSKLVITLPIISVALALFCQSEHNFQQIKYVETKGTCEKNLR